MTALIELFYTFLIIGFTSFGGMSMVPLINSEMISHGWMTPEEVMDIVGALAATLGVLTPSLTLCLFAAVFFERFKENKSLQAMLYGVRPVCVGLIAATVISLGGQTYVENGALYWQTALIGGMITLLIWKWKLSVPKVIVLAAALGLILGGL